MECMREKFYDGVVLDGRYQAISPLNHGSFGMVFMAKDLTTNDLVAIKCLTKRSATGESESSFAIDDKSEELECHSQLGQHPNIVNLLNSFETDAHVYLVLEFCSNGDLYEAIRTGCGPLETEHVREFMLQLVDAVQYIHSKGIYHRDIKPENIFLDSTGAMKLGDFGLVTREEWSYETTVGSDRYMAPEQYDSAGAGYSPPQADIWAIGICLLNILFSRNPFTTPTEADPLYLDFTRDRQSLFDVFPTMSQDTYEVIVQCMSLDPKKRSLEGAREALLRVVSFTTFDEALDDFCTIPKTTTVSANREPLRTPSIQSPQVDQGSFPWAKALHASPPQQYRQFSAIQEADEIHDEDLFASSGDSISQDWCSLSKYTPSAASVMESNLGESMKAMAIRRPNKPVGPPRAEKLPVSGSLPINMTKTKPMPMPSMASVFGRKRDLVSKSWSDMWEEDEEDEEEQAHENELKQKRQEQNARTWSHDSKNEDVTVRVGLSEPKSSSFINIKPVNDKKVDKPFLKDIDNDPNDGFFFQDHTMTRQYSPPRYSPPSKRSTFDKWAALGDKRRGATNGNDKSPVTEKSPDAGWRSRKDAAVSGKGWGFGVLGGFWDKDDKVNGKVKDWTKARDQCQQRTQFGDLELGWSYWHDNLHM